MMKYHNTVDSSFEVRLKNAEQAEKAQAKSTRVSKNNAQKMALSISMSNSFYENLKDYCAKNSINRSLFVENAIRVYVKERGLFEID